jgi:hypothetical protein
MARIRTLKPEFWQNEKLSSLPLEAHFLAAALLNYADDFGYFNAHPGLIRAACVTLREDFGSIPELLLRLQTVDYLRLSEGSDGRLYGWIVNFSDHQKVSHPTASKIAALADFPENFGSPPDSFRPEGNREQGTGNGILRSGRADPDRLAGFDQFYSAYPRKRSRGDAEKAWQKLKPDAEMLALILAALESAKASDDWTRDGGKFIPYPASWLNAKGWADEFHPPFAVGIIGATQSEIDKAAQLRWEYENGHDAFAAQPL